MPRTASVVVAIALSLAVPVFGQASQPQQTPATGTGLLAGRIIDAKTNAPIAYATVDLAPHNAQALTDGEGRFVFGELPKGSYTLRASKPGWIGQAYGSRRPGGPSVPVALADAERRADIVIGLYKYAVIGGRVIDDNGDPIVNVDVRIFQRNFVAGRPRWTSVGNGPNLQRAHTDDRGVYRFSNLTPGDYIVAVPTTVTSQPAGFTESSRFDADFLRSMTSVGAAPMSLDAGTMRAGLSSVTTSPFDLPIPPPTDGSTWRTYPTTFAPSARTVTAAPVVTVTAGYARTDVDITMHLVPTYQVSGHITGPSGPVSTCAVHLLPADSAGAPLIDTAVAISDATGSFTMFGVPAGQYVARVVRLPAATAPERYAITGGTDAIQSVRLVMNGPLTDASAPVPTDPLLSVDQPVVVGDGPVTGLDLALRVGPRITGRVVFDGRTAAQPTPAQVANLAITPVRADGTADNVLPPGRASSDGTFATVSMWPARYLLRAAEEVHLPGTGAESVWHLKGATLNGQDIMSTPFDLTTDMKDVVITYTDQAASVTGTVSSDDPKQAPFAVILFPSDANAWVDYGRGNPRVQMVTAGANGTFTLAGQPPAGTYALVAIPDDEADDWQNPAVLARLLPFADQIEIRDGQPLTHALHVRSLR